MNWLKENNCPWDQYTFMKAIEQGNMKNIDWLIDNGCPYDNYSLVGNKDLL